MELDISLKTLYELAIEVSASAILALIAGPVAIILAKRMDAIDVPGSAAHKKHAAPTPLAGGLVLLLVMPILATIFGLWKAPHIPWVLAGTAVIFIFGLLDDMYGLSAPQKFTGQIIATAILLAGGISVKFLENFHLPFPAWLILALNTLVTLLWMVGLTNASNLLDSMDGLVAGVATISSGFFTLISLASGQPVLSQFSALIFGVCISLYLYNMTPARFFLGDSGAQVLGFMLAAIGILYNPPNLPQGSTWFMPILLLGIPIFDTTLVVVSRLRRHKPIFQADLAHTYHRLVRLGLTPGQAVLSVQIAAILLCNAAFLAMSLTPKAANVLFVCILLAGAAVIIIFERVAKIEG